MGRVWDVRPRGAPRRVGAPPGLSGSLTSSSPARAESQAGVRPEPHPRAPDNALPSRPTAPPPSLIPSLSPRAHFPRNYVGRRRSLAPPRSATGARRGARGGGGRGATGRRPSVRWGPGAAEGRRRGAGGRRGRRRRRARQLAETLGVPLRFPRRGRLPPPPGPLRLPRLGPGGATTSPGPARGVPVPQSDRQPPQTDMSTHSTQNDAAPQYEK